MHHYIYTNPESRINDNWANSTVDAAPVNKNFKHCLITGFSNDHSTRFQANFYTSIALDLVTETVYNYPYPYISEKTLRPIASKRMFIIIGAAHTLCLLQDKGFQTFSDVIDERYDQIKNPVDRWYALEIAIKSFLVKPLSEIQDILLSQQTKLEHNFKILKDLQNTELKNV